MNNKIKNIIIGIFAVILLLLVARSCSMDEKMEKLKLNNLEQIDSIKNVYNQTVVLKDVEITNSKEALKKATDSLFNLKASQDKKIKDVIAFYKSKVRIRIDSVDVPYEDTLAKKRWEDSVNIACAKVIEYYEANTISVPRTARDSTEHYKADLTATMNGISINNLELVDNQSIRWVVYKGGLFKKDIYGKRHLWLKKNVGVQVIHSNPNIKVLGMQSAIYQAPKKHNLLGKAILIGIGVYLGSKL